MLSGCQAWLDEQRQANLKQCERACSSVFAENPQHYTMCMNAGLQPDGYYDGSACQTHIEPHSFCLSAGYKFPEAGRYDDHAYADCVANYLQKKADRQFTRQQSEQEKRLNREQVCTVEAGKTRCVTRQY